MEPRRGNYPVVLGLDVSKTATGWAIGRSDEAPTSGVQRFKDKTPDDLWYSAYKWMNDMIDVHAPTVVWIEAPMERMAEDEQGHMLTSVETLGMLWSLQAVMRMVVRARLPSIAQLVAVSTARKSFTSKGTYPKGEAKPAIIRHAIACGWLPEGSRDDARADACCVWAHGALLSDRSVIERIRPQLLGKARIAQPNMDVSF